MCRTKIRYTYDIYEFGSYNIFPVAKEIEEINFLQMCIFAQNRRISKQFSEC